MKNLILIFMMLFTIDSIAQLDQREKGDVVSPALNKNPNFIQRTGWTIEAIDPINDALCSVTPSSDNLTILTTNVCNARVYQDINSADIRKARFDKETMTAFLKLQSLTYVKITLNVYKKAATTETLTLLRTRSLENNSNVPLRDKKIVFDVVTEDLNFVPNAALADSLRIEFTFEPTVVFPAGVAKVEVNDFRVFSSPMNYSPLLHEVKEESGWTAWQPITITAATTNPTKGTTTTDACRKRRDGTQLKIDFEYRQETAGTAGSGVYYFSCGGFTLNGESLTPDYDLNNTVNIGGGDGNADSLFSAGLNPAGNIILINGAGTVSSTNQPLSDAGKIYRFNVSIAIREWRQSSISTSNQNEISNPRNWAKFSARVNAAGTGFDSNNSNGIITTATKTSNVVTVNFSGLTSPPDCSVSGVDIMGNEAIYRGGRIITLTSSSISYITTAVGASSSGYINIPAVIKCEKTGQDFVDAWKKTATAYLKESLIIKDVEQFHTDERKICDACYKGGALYKKCAETSGTGWTPGSNIMTGLGTGRLVKEYGYTTYSEGQRSLVATGGSYLAYVTKLEQNLVFRSSGNSGDAWVCIEYTK